MTAPSEINSTVCKGDSSYQNARSHQPLRRFRRTAPLANPIAIDNYFIAFAPWGARTAIFFLTRFSHPTMRPFVLELGELQNKILEMGGLVEMSIHNSIRS